MQEATSWAPGRIEVLGNHTDYNEGLVLACAIDLGIRASTQRLQSPVARFSSAMGTPPLEMPLDAITPLKDDHAWANYPLGVLHLLQERGIDVPGFSLFLESDLPVGAGLSSSAALELATGLTLLKLADAELPREDLARLCQRAENEFVGVNCGLLDQFASAFGQRDHLVSLDFRNGSVRTLPFPSHLAFIVAHSGIRHRLLDGEYNERRERCAAAARTLGLRALRDIDPTELDRRAPELDPAVLRRARHVVAENTRVQLASTMLDAGRAEEMGPLLSASHESSRLDFENSTPELDLLVEIACTLPGALGARLTGGGFGGAIIILARRDSARPIADTLATDYHKRTGIECQTWICGTSDGAR